MCLYIKRNQEENKRDLQDFLGDQEELFVYKVLQKRPDENFHRSTVYNDFIWNLSKQKVFQVNRSNKLTEVDLERGEVSYGFHVYTNLETAKESKHYCDHTIVKFKVLKKDIIAIENRADTPINCLDLRQPTPNFQRLVCRKLTFVEVL
jgi:hypothetical protein